MKTLLYTGFDGKYEELAAITIPRMAKYANRWGFDFQFRKDDNPDPDHIYWTGLRTAVKAFRDEGFDRVIYLDTDQLVTNFEFEIPDFKYGFNASKDWGNDAVEPWHFSMCGFVAFPSALPMMQRVLSTESEWAGKPFQEQAAVQEYCRGLIGDAPMRETNPENPMPALFNIHPRKVFNCVPDQVCPGAVPEPWAPGDWCAHLTMVDLPRRIQIAKEILGQL